MKPRDDGGVVDSTLNVYGVKSLKVAGECSVGFPYSPLTTSIS
jgi:hypothetical protein